MSGKATEEKRHEEKGGGRRRRKLRGGEGRSQKIRQAGMEAGGQAGRRHSHEEGNAASTISIY